MGQFFKFLLASCLGVFLALIAISVFGTIMLTQSEICYLYPQGINYCWLVLKGGKKILVRGSVDHFENELKRPPFIRVHPEYIVNQKCILQVLNGKRITIKMSNNDRIPVSTDFFDLLLK